MVRGLLYRHLFKLAEGALAGLCLLWVGFFVFNNFVLATRGPSKQDSFPGVFESEFEFARTGPPGAYSEIIRSGIFGAAAKDSAANVPLPVVVPPPTEEITKLPLLLKGTMLAGRRDPFASAIVQHKDRGQLTMTYFIGNEVLDKVYLDEVLAHEVILRNERENKLEHLPMLEPYEIAANTSAVPAPRTDRATRPKLAELRANTIKLNQKEIHQRLLDEYVDIATKVDVKEHKDANGKVIGLTSSNVSQIGLAKDLGLQDNDILTTINNQPVDSTDSILKVLNRFAGARSFRIGIIRGGKQQYLNYSLK